MDAQEQYEVIVEELAAEAPDVTAGKMFGMPTIKVGTKAIGGLRGDAMVFKLGPEAHAKAMALPGAEAFDPSGGRPMKEWVVVPSTQAEHWPDLARAALAYRSGG